MEVRELAARLRRHRHPRCPEDDSFGYLYGSRGNGEPAVAGGRSRLPSDSASWDDAFLRRAAIRQVPRTRAQAAADDRLKAPARGDREVDALDAVATLPV